MGPALLTAVGLSGILIRKQVGAPTFLQQVAVIPLFPSLKAAQGTLALPSLSWSDWLLLIPGDSL